MAKVTPLCWIGVGLPFRPCDGTYGVFEPQQMPAIEIDAKFADLHTVEDVAKNLTMLKAIFNSPTACYFDTDFGNGVFYRDQQDCVLWCISQNGQVMVYQSEMVVARSLPEFLSRVNLENRLWYKTIATRFSRDQQALTDEEQAYVDALKASADK